MSLFFVYLSLHQCLPLAPLSLLLCHLPQEDHSLEFDPLASFTPCPLYSHSFAFSSTLLLLLFFFFFYSSSSTPLPLFPLSFSNGCRKSMKESGVRRTSRVRVIDRRETYTSVRSTSFLLCHLLLLKEVSGKKNNQVYIPVVFFSLLGLSFRSAFLSFLTRVQFIRLFLV